eukprot:gnl/TRDRNA2_/TRDRNA2_37293_c0_seq1.p1 gnl/TRDRNA2_/TRDRNA2_37293_c0~~gnl/TRDRNA2_/TRDRNA2_37293_c0_seq1.p1  ORF type:complete len:117 (+),score=31.72 gnl/TRDRNA2_/TRDRNA2_37293_c0_seq1:29-379(+)
MAAKIEGSSASRLQRMQMAIMGQLKPGVPLYSLGFGIVGGIALSGLVYVGRTMSILMFDHEYYKLQSRHRYYEKQLLFSREKDEEAKAHYLASLSAEYDPVATRMPFKPMDPKYKF